MSHGVVWFRRDLRLGDNPAWSGATSRHDQVTALFVVDPALWNVCSLPRVALLAEHLRRLDGDLRSRGGRLRVEHGDPAVVVPALAAALKAEVSANRDLTPYAAARDEQVERQTPISWHHGLSVHPPGTVTTGAGDTYRVFTPFAAAWLGRSLDPWPTERYAIITTEGGSGIPETGPPPLVGGERAALERLERFAEQVDRYPAERDRPDLDTTSRLSIDLKYGTLAARTVYERIGTSSESRWAFVRQLAWRDFYAAILIARPDTVEHAMRTEYDRIRWRDDPAGLEAWKEGSTGFPIVDAGMRQLRAEGWMHNRVRMITASFLVKDLLIDWRAGERYFRRALLDADVSQNVGNWQWVAGTGADAAPYFRIFNPVTQSKRFDPEGAYIRRWIPELTEVPTPAIHAPWRAGPLELATWGVSLGETYPNPIVDHAEARVRTLDTYKRALAERAAPGQAG